MWSLSSLTCIRDYQKDFKILISQTTGHVFNFSQLKDQSQKMKEFFLILFIY